MELNPKHPVVNEMRDQWHKIAAILLWKMAGKGGFVDISDKDIEAFMASGTSNIVIKPKDKTLSVWLVDDTTALRLSEEA